MQRSLLELESDVAAGRLRRGEAIGEAHAQHGLSETRYWQEVLATLEDEDALVEFPMLINRLERLKQERRGRRRRQA